MIKLSRLLSYTALIAISIAMLSCVKESTPTPIPPNPPTPSLHEDETINKKMDAILKEYYLWNEEYIKLIPNYAQAYDIFLSNQLMSMTTNIYDKKQNGNGGYNLYSHIQRLKPVKSKSSAIGGVNHNVLKEEKISYGIADISVVQYIDNNGNLTEEVGITVRGVYPDSPADKAGIKRGFVITKVNDIALTTKNYADYWYKLLYPTTEGVKLVLTENVKGHPIKEVTSEQIYPNPVLMAKVFTEGRTKIGYIVYEGFDAAYDNDLLAVIKTIKEAGANEMILDLRLNSGGNITSANMLSSSIASEACRNKVFQYYSFNKARMANPEETSRKLGIPFDSNRNKFFEKFAYEDYFGVDLHNYALNIKRLYVIVSNSTASASEALISSLIGIGFPVELIGAKTSGKNVGMETQLLQDDRYNYFFAPITFEYYNAQEQAVNYLGMDPDYAVNDWTSNGYSDFGTTADPCFAKAYQLITGITPRIITKATHKAINAILLETELPTNKPEREGMLMLPPSKK